MAKRQGVRLTAHVLLVFAVASYFVATFGDSREIARVKADAEQLAAERDSMQQIVDLVNRRQDGLRRMHKTPDLQARLEEAFPEMAESRWGVTTIPLDQDDPVGLEYFVVPVWFTETFLIDHQDAQSWREQKDRLVALDSLNLQVIALQDSVEQLEVEKSRAFEAGYHEAYASYQDLSQRYLAELKKPRLSLGSTLGLCLGAAGAGVLVGSVINE